MKFPRLIPGLIAGSLSTVLALGAAADEAEGVTVSVLAGATTLEDLDNESHIQLGLGYRFDNPWGVEFVYSSVDSESDDSPPIGAEVNRWHVDALYHLKDVGQLTPYLAFGAGNGAVNFDGGFDNDDRLLNAGIGAKFPLSDNLFLRGDFRLYRVKGVDDLERTVGVGLHYVFGAAQASSPAAPAAPSDRDRDGVPDSSDRCPGTARGASVDAAGCADSDGDGV